MYKITTNDEDGQAPEITQSLDELTRQGAHRMILVALRDVHSEAEEQRCWKYKIANVLDKLPKRLQPQGERHAA